MKKKACTPEGKLPVLNFIFSVYLCYTYICLSIGRQRLWHNIIITVYYAVITCHLIKHFYRTLTSPDIKKQIS